MGLIKILSEKIANKIAAGEVVERPSSIVKELVENSLDAGADSIEILVRHGGKSLIRVADNGSGMSAEDAELAFRRHATSKITDVHDLERIMSYGFRGEALPSIGAVARVKLITRDKGSSSGVEIMIDGGSVQSAKPSPASQGTIVEVRDLFFNTPARRKFLKSDETELGNIMDAVARVALSRRDVHFTLKNGEKIVFDFLPGETLLARAVKVLGDETQSKLVEFEEQEKGVTVSGVIGKPSISRMNRTEQIFFVNSRWVKAYGFGYALEAAYHGLIMPGQHPVAVLFVEVDPAKVDVNVHPTKQEVRISGESQLKSLIRDAVRRRLEATGDLAPELKHPVSSSFSDRFAPDRNVPSYGSAQNVEGQKSLGIAEPAPFIDSSPSWEESGLKPIQLQNLTIKKILGQIHHTFIIAETEEGYMVVDQHAAHERVMFEVLMQGMKSGAPQKQNLLMEEILKVHPKIRQAFVEKLPTLVKAGFDIEEFGENEFVLRAYPAVFEKEDPAAALKSFLEDLEEGRLSTRLEEQNAEVAALIACKRKSVKGFDPMSLPAMRSLLERLAQCENPYNCPHGRPTFFKQSFLDLEKQFKRK